MPEMGLKLVTTVDASQRAEFIGPELQRQFSSGLRSAGLGLRNAAPVDAPEALRLAPLCGSSRDGG